MFADPTTQNDELLKGKSNLISKPYFSVSTRLLYHLCSWLTIYCYMKLFAMSLCCFPCPSGHVQRASPHQVRWLPWISILHPVPSSRFCLESRSVPFDKLLHCQCRTSPWGDTRISISSNRFLKVTKSHGSKKSVGIISLISLPHAWETKQDKSTHVDALCSC